MALLLICILSYILLIRYLGYYWDDWAFVWISQKLGTAGMIRYFHTIRPTLRPLYQITTSLLGHVPWHWHVFALVWRWITSVMLWGLLRTLWPRNPQAALWTSLLFTVYPGPRAQFIALVYSHYFLLLSAFFASLWFSLIALRRPKWYLPLSFLGLLLALLNLISLEYFFLLELIRPALLWMVSGEEEPASKNRRKRVLLHSLPYLLLFAGVVIWRAYFFTHQTYNYPINLLDELRLQPISTLLSLGQTILQDLWITTFGAWGQVLVLPDPSVFGRLATLVYAGVVALVFTGTLFYLLFSRKSDPLFSSQKNRFRLSGKPAPWAVSALVLGLIGLLLAGPPYWLTGLNVSLYFPNTRFTLSFMLGASLFLAGLMGMLPISSRFKVLLLAVLIGLGAGQQFRYANSFRQDDDIQKALFWQMAWRMPDIEPGTALLTNELPLHYSTDNSLTAALNWIYDPENSSARMDYYLFYPDMRLNTSLPPLESGETIEQDYLATMFYGSTEQVVAVYFEPPGCLRVLDPETDPVNPLLPEIMRYSAKYSTTAAILPASEGGAVLQEDIFGPELEHNWCYYFEKADLARQLGDWQKVAALGEPAFALNDHPNDPAERMPFIEGYAHTGNWQRAVDLTADSFQVTPRMQVPLCELWERIAAETPDSLAKKRSLQVISEILSCE
jgi:hypothetical protein